MNLAFEQVNSRLTRIDNDMVYELSIQINDKALKRSIFQALPSHEIDSVNPAWDHKPVSGGFLALVDLVSVH